ncbi:hypothetical protein BJX61DRAFT_159797 [Aspergillus egyptiacus]|nr:hypothetical protein BJX61DRAFT_159797 [Aspergillus egyptiacus]
MWKELSIIRRSSRAGIRPVQRFRLQAQRTTRPFSAMTSLRSQPQDEEDHFHDRSKLDPHRTENSQSATTDEVASTETAFDASQTSPESQLSSSKEESKRKGTQRDPLGVSAADKGSSPVRDPKEDGAEKNAETGAHSMRGTTTKNRERK